VTLHKTKKYELVKPNIPYGVIMDEDMLGRVLQLRYADHYIKNTMKFPELAPHYYLELRIYPTMN